MMNEVAWRREKMAAEDQKGKRRRQARAGWQNIRWQPGRHLSNDDDCSSTFRDLQSVPPPRRTQLMWMEVTLGMTAAT
jgi:hypothetical protein